MRLVDIAPMLEKLDLEHYDKDYCVNQFSADWIYSWLDEQPTIEAEPVKRGRWVKHYVDGTNMNGKPTKILFACNCSQCELDGEYPTNYCPNCGAKMEEDER